MLVLLDSSGTDTGRRICKEGGEARRVDEFRYILYRQYEQPENTAPTLPTDSHNLMEYAPQPLTNNGDSTTALAGNYGGYRGQRSAC
jgi:hypothetical protein